MLFLSLCTLITACGESSEPEETLLIDSAYLESNTNVSPSIVNTNPPSMNQARPVVFPLQNEDEIEIKVGELFGHDDFDWVSLFKSTYTVSTPEITEGEGTVCILSDDLLSVLAKAPGSCTAKYPGESGESKGFVFLTIKVVEG